LTIRIAPERFLGEGGGGGADGVSVVVVMDEIVASAGELDNARFDTRMRLSTLDPAPASLSRAGAWAN